MKVSDIMEGLRKGTVSLDTRGHDLCSGDKHYKEYLLDRYDHAVDAANGGLDGKWEVRAGETLASVNASMIMFYQRMLDKIPDKNGIVHIGFTDGWDCSKCGAKLRFSFESNKLITDVVFDHTIDLGHRFKGDFVRLKNRCSHEFPKPITGRINITDKIVFANFFREIEDCPDELKYREEYSLNSYRGRENRAKYKAERNVAYGQMGNMSMSLYVNAAKDSIIIGTSYRPEEFQEWESDEAYEAAMAKPLFEGFEKFGEIHTSVWRWEATDFKTIEPYYENIKGYAHDLTELEVKKGIWQFEHFYDVERYVENLEIENPVYATLKWVE